MFLFLGFLALNELQVNTKKVYLEVFKTSTTAEISDKQAVPVFRHYVTENVGWDLCLYVAVQEFAFPVCPNIVTKISLFEY